MRSWPRLPKWPAAGSLFVSQLDTVFALEPATGRWLWQYRRELPTGFTIRGTTGVRILGDQLIAGFADGTLAGLHASDGSLIWERRLGAEASGFTDVDATPVIGDDDRIYAAAVRGGVFCLDPVTGAIAWNTKVAGVTSLTAGGEIIYAAGDGLITALLRTDGRQLWSFKPKDLSAGQPVLAWGQLVVPTFDALSFIDPSSGQRTLVWNPGRGVSAPALSVGDRLYVLSNLGRLYALRLERADG